MDDLICLRCKNYDPMFGCYAFDNGLIPDEIIESNQHSEPIYGQSNDLVFELNDDDDDRDLTDELFTIWLN